MLRQLVRLITLLTLPLLALEAQASDTYPVPDKETFEETCDDMGGEYVEDGTDFFACELSSGTTVACLDWYGCIAWSESSRVRDHRVGRFGVGKVIAKGAMQRRHPQIKRAYLRAASHARRT